MNHFRAARFVFALVLCMALLPGSSTQASRVSLTVRPLYMEQPHQFTRPGSSASYQVTFVDFNGETDDQQTFQIDTAPTKALPGIQTDITPSSVHVRINESATFTVTVSASPTTPLGQDLRQIRVTTEGITLTAQLPITTTVANQSFLPTIPSPEYFKILGTVKTNSEIVGKGSCVLWALLDVQNVRSVPVTHGHVHGTFRLYYNLHIQGGTSIIYPGGTFDQDVNDVVFPGEIRHLAIPMDISPGDPCGFDYPQDIQVSVTAAEPVPDIHPLTVTSPSIDYREIGCFEPTSAGAYAYTATGILRNDTSAPLHELHVSVHKQQQVYDDIDPDANEVLTIDSLAPGAMTPFSIHRQWGRIGCGQPQTNPWTVTAWGSTAP